MTVIMITFNIIVYWNKEALDAINHTMRKVHTRPALTWTAVSTITEFRSHQQALGNLTNA